jgi:hypothetical protein
MTLAVFMLADAIFALTLDFYESSFLGIHMITVRVVRSQYKQREGMQI